MPSRVSRLYDVVACRNFEYPKKKLWEMKSEDFIPLAQLKETDCRQSGFRRFDSPRATLPKRLTRAWRVLASVSTASASIFRTYTDLMDQSPHYFQDAWLRPPAATTRIVASNRETEQFPAA